VGWRADIEAIAISAMTRTQVLVDHGGGAIGPVIGFADPRAAAITEELRARLPPDDPETAEVNAFHPLARLYWLARHEPGMLARAKHVLDPKDFLNAQLTGVFASDAISQARLVASRRTLFDAAGIATGLLPPLRAPLSVLGHVQHGCAQPFERLACVPVITMAHDTWASVLGLGALRAGYAYNLSGTSEVLGLCTHHAARAKGLLTLDWSAGLSQIGGPSLAGGDTIRWLRDLLGAEADIADLAARAQDDAPPLLFLPYLAGERTPHWDPHLRGAWIGLGREHGPPHLARAVLEGIAHVNRLVLTRAEAAAGHAAIEIRFGGGGAVNAVWCQIKADLLARPVVVTQSDDHGLIGAAIAARVALGADLATAQARMVRVARRYEPDPSRQPRANALYQLYCDADAALAPISRRLATFDVCQRT
jgi:xylulokinase